MPKKRTTYPVTPEEFVTAWEQSETVEAAAEKLGMPPDIVVARAANYRGKGVNLKKMARPGRKSLDVGGLNKQIADIQASKNKKAKTLGIPQPLNLANDHA